jgi:hypothetical protein
MPEPLVTVAGAWPRQIKRSTEYQHNAEGAITGKIETETDAQDPTWKRVQRTTFVTNEQGEVIGKEELEDVDQP